jgi:hypothetical protein
VITGIFPLGGKAGGRTAVEVRGWNLPVARTSENFTGKPAGTYGISIRQGGWTSNLVPFALDSLPQAKAKADAERREKAQRVKLPVMIDGRLAQPGETPFFRFNGRAGEEIVAEVTARRLGSPLDSTLRLTDAAGKELAFNDDFEDKGAGLLTHQADSLIDCKLPKKGTYYLQLADAQHNGGSEYGYRLRISHPRPDFELRVAPSSLNLRAGSTAPVTVYALRRDGFAGAITLQLADAPDGFRLSGAAVPAGEDSVRITLTVPRTAITLPLSIHWNGQAIIEGREVAHAAVPAEYMEQAFAYHHLVAQDAWMVRVIGEGGNLPWHAVTIPVKLPSGGFTSFEVFVPPRLVLSGVKLALDDAPDGISIENIAVKPNGVAITLRVQAEKARPSMRGNLILDAFREVKPQAGLNQVRRQSLGTLPAIPFEVVAPKE